MAGRHSPKEDGEIGETLQDVVQRHQSSHCLNSPPMLAYKTIESLAADLTPGLARVTGRCLSAALSPVDGLKASPTTAMEGLEAVKVSLMERKEKRKSAVKRLHESAELEREEMLEKERLKRGQRLAARKAAIAARPPPKKRHMERSGRVWMSY